MERQAAADTDDHHNATDDDEEDYGEHQRRLQSLHDSQSHDNKRRRVSSKGRYTVHKGVGEEKEEEKYDDGDGVELQQQQRLQSYNDDDDDNYFGGPISSSSSASPSSTSSSASQRLYTNSSLSRGVNAPVDIGAAVAQEAEEEAEVYESEPAHASMFPPLKEGETLDFCFVCQAGQNEKEELSNPRVIKMAELFDNNFGKMDPVQCCELVQNWYEAEVRPYAKWAKPWCLQSIYEHYTNHTPSVVALEEDSLRVFNKAMHIVKNEGLFRVNKKKNKRCVDSDSLKMYLNLYNVRKVLIREILGRRA